MRLLGIDLGTKTMGLAITDSLQMVASGLENFEYQNNDLNICVQKIQKLLIVYQNDLEKIVLGYPTNVNNTKNNQTILVERFHKLLNDIIPNGVTIILQDERYTTMKATGMMKYGAGLKSSQIKKIKDKMSAVVILQEYMERI